MHYLCMLLTYGHQICTAGASEMSKPKWQIHPQFSIVFLAPYRLIVH